jgi:tetratricopeptide (TPR) repeat protein
VPLLYILITFSMEVLTSSRLRGGARHAAWAAAVTGIAAATLIVPRHTVLEARRYEIGLNTRLTKYAEMLESQAGPRLSIATPTIGAIAYLTDARVIDMLGLTEPDIAKHPEHLPGLSSTWKERKFNSGYVLAQEPDFIMFSTGTRPSALAEKPLFMHSSFRRNYRLYLFKDFKGRSSSFLHIYKRKDTDDGIDHIYPDPAFVELYSKAIHLCSIENRHDEAIRILRKMFKVMPDDFVRGYELMGVCYFYSGDTDSALAYSLKAVEMDPYSVEAHGLLHDIYVMLGDRKAARRHADVLMKYDPDMMRQAQ